MGEWAYAEIWETIADAGPDAPALVHGDRRLTWGDLDRQADGLARALLDRGAAHQDKVAAYLYNCPEYLITVLGAFKAGLVPVNTNFRYGPDELVHLWTDSDAAAVVFHGAFAERVEQVRDRVPAVRTWLWVDDGSGACPGWAVPFEAAVAPGRVRAPWGVSGSDLVIVYTGGTTGRPKGVMWRQHDMYRVFDTQSDPDEADLGRVARRVGERPRPVGIPAPPLMHSTALMFAFTLLNQGGRVVTLPGRRFDPAELLEVTERERVNVIAIVGDAFARPIVETLEARPAGWDLARLELVASAGVMLSADVRSRLLAHLPNGVVIDVLGATEAYGMGVALSSAADPAPTGRFRPGGHTVVLGEDGSVVEPGSGAVGRLAVRGLGPVGYYKDPDASAATFVEIEGERYSVPGDWATVEADGTITLLGRGSGCINTGGEKVFPEEVEEVLKLHPAVRDAGVVGVPDPRLGEAVTAVVELEAVDGAGAVGGVGAGRSGEVPGGAGAGRSGEVPGGARAVDTADLVAHVKARLAHYKAPRHVVVVERLERGPNGKVDYRATRQLALDRLPAARSDDVSPDP